MGSPGSPNLKVIHDRDQGWEDQWWLLWQHLEAHILSSILSGPLNDPDACRLRPRFRGLLRDAFSALDFVSEILVDRQRRAQAGTLLDEEMAQLEIQEVVHRLASASWLRKRAITYSALRDTGGVGGLADKSRSVQSLDNGEEHALVDTLRAPESNPYADSEQLEITRALLRGMRVLRLDIASGQPLASIEETASVQCWPRLDPAYENHPWIASWLQEHMTGGVDGLDREHEDSLRRLQAEHEKCVDELIDHPGMTANTREEVRRRQYKALLRMLLEPLDAGQLMGLLGLPSVNAADKRNSKYRAARTRLLPELFAEFDHLEGRG